MKTILVELDPHISDGRLDCAADVARAFGSHVVGVQATPASAFVSFDPFGGVYAMPAVLEAISEREAETRAVFEAEMAREGVLWEYRHAGGAPADVISKMSRLADLVLVGKGTEDGSGRNVAHVGDMVLASQAPVLALQKGAKTFDPFGRILVAWNGSPEAAAAVRQALPLLSRASEVVLMTAEEPTGKWDLPATDLAVYLSRHGIEGKIENLGVSGRDVDGAILRHVTEKSPSCLVMGAYGRSRAREWLLGGVTRRMLLESPVPLFLAH